MKFFFSIPLNFKFGKIGLCSKNVHYLPCVGTKTLVEFLFCGIIDEDTFYGSWIKLTLVLRVHMNKSGTPKKFERKIGRKKTIMREYFNEGLTCV